MTSRDFCYWLQGFFEINGDDTVNLTEGQLKCIKRHLNMVFIHEIDPSMGDEKHRRVLQDAHDPENGPRKEVKIPMSRQHVTHDPNRRIMC